jgi:hypothetical protein
LHRTTASRATGGLAPIDDDPSHASVCRMAKDVAANRRAGRMCQWSAARNVCAANLGPCIGSVLGPSGAHSSSPASAGSHQAWAASLGEANPSPHCGDLPQRACIDGGKPGSRQINSRPEGTRAPSVSW